MTSNQVADLAMQLQKLATYMCASAAGANEYIGETKVITARAEWFAENGEQLSIQANRLVQHALELANEQGTIVLTKEQ